MLSMLLVLSPYLGMVILILIFHLINIPQVNK